MTKKRIYNPVTKKYYHVKNKTTKRGKIGQIKGLWDKVSPRVVVSKKVRSET